MNFDNKFFGDIPKNPIHSVVEICKTAINETKDINIFNVNEDSVEIYFEYYALLKSIFESDILESATPVPKITGKINHDFKEIEDYIKLVLEEFGSAASELRIKSLSENFKMKIKVDFSYSFTDGDITRLKELIDELENDIDSSEFIDGEYKKRLLERLRVLKSELGKYTDSLDKFWGLIGDAGSLLGKYGEEARPIFNHYKEVVEIAWNTQSTAEELPSNAKNPFLLNKK